MRIIYFKPLLFLLACALLTVNGFTQSKANIDQLNKKLNNTANDTTKVWLLHDLSYAYIYNNPDSAYSIAQRELSLATDLHYQRGIVRGLNDLGNVLWTTGHFPKALETYLSALKVSEEIHDMDMKALCYMNIGNVYLDLDNSEKAIEYLNTALDYATILNVRFKLLLANMNLGESYLKVNLDSSLHYTNRAHALAIELKDIKYTGRVIKNLGNYHLKTKNYEEAREHYHTSIPLLKETYDYRGLSQAYISMVNYLSETNHKNDSIIKYAQHALLSAHKDDYSIGILQASGHLSKAYLKSNKDSAIKYLVLENLTRNSVFGIQKTRELQLMSLNEKVRLANNKREEIQNHHKHQEHKQAVAITIFILMLISITLIVIKQKIRSRTFATLGILSFLMVFEFINLLIHPHIAKWTDHNLILMLIIMLSIALAIAPIHHRVEKWLKGKIAIKEH